MELFKNRGLHFIHLNISSLLSNIEELRFITKATNDVVIGVCESKLDASVLELIIIKVWVVIEQARRICSLQCKK